MKLHRDELTRRLYANDASMYEELPYAVCFPKNSSDLKTLISEAKAKKLGIIPRAAGTSLAGQATGNGIIMDVSRFMTGQPEIFSEQKRARVEPGVIRDDLNRLADEHGLIFGPDTSTTNRCMIGGMIGNNSSGSFSIKYKTTRENIHSVNVVLSDGSEVEFGPLSEEELQQKCNQKDTEGRIYREMLSLLQKNRQKILESYPHPEILRRNTGYALDKLCEMKPLNPEGRPFNLAELICGSEGTLALISEATLRLTKKDAESVLLIPQFKNLNEAMLAVQEAVAMEPAAVELVDHIILDATKHNLEQNKNRFFLDGEPNCILIIQFDGDDSQLIHDKANKLRQKLKQLEYGYAYPIISEREKMKRVWELRKAGLGLLMGLNEETRSPTFCEDTAVRVADLPEYVNDFRKILEKYQTDCVFYAHASVGELHLRPVLDISTEEGIEKMKAMADDIADLVISYKGSLSGEHGDGRARSPYIRKVLGDDMVSLLEDVKNIWDPDGIFNPGKITDPKPVDEDLRFSSSYKKPENMTVFRWEKEKGFGNALELCNGAAVCRKIHLSEGAMCPSYQATLEEKDSTRGRANVFRQVFTGQNPAAFESDELYEALDLCLSCKACKSECPANVDMAKMKAEFLQGRYDEKGVKLSDRMFAELGTVYRLAGFASSLTNFIKSRKITKKLAERFLHIDSGRSIPEFKKQTLLKWFRNRDVQYENRPHVILMADLFINYHEPEIGKAAVKVLESMGYEVIIPDMLETGRAQISKGFLRKAKVQCDMMLEVLEALLDSAESLIVLEPSDLSCLHDEYPDLCSEGLIPIAKKTASKAESIESFILKHIDQFIGDAQQHTETKVFIHQHCHSKALNLDQDLAGLLEKVGYEVESADTGCCGMAGSFGYEKGHAEISYKIGELKLFPAVRKSDAEYICTSGFSCRHQLKDGMNKNIMHPVELLFQILDKND